ncbi:unnamed protein product [Lota lota]
MMALQLSPWEAPLQPGDAVGKVPRKSTSPSGRGGRGKGHGRQRRALHNWASICLSPPTTTTHNPFLPPLLHAFEITLTN